MAQRGFWLPFFLSALSFAGSAPRFCRSALSFAGSAPRFSLAEMDVFHWPVFRGNFFVVRLAAKTGPTNLSQFSKNNTLLYKLLSCLVSSEFTNGFNEILTAEKRRECVFGRCLPGIVPRLANSPGWPIQSAAPAARGRGLQARGRKG